MEFYQAVVTMIIGAIGSAIPFYFKIRSMSLAYKEKEHKFLEVSHQLNTKMNIDHEAEWKRIIEYRDQELVRLRDRDDQQDKALKDLYEKHIECKRNEAQQAQKINYLDERVKRLEEILKSKGELAL